MPSFLVTGDEKHRIEFEDGSWIDIRSCVTGLMRARWSKAAAVMRTKVTGNGKAAVTTTEGDFDNERFLAAMLKDIVLGWSDPSPVDVAKLSEAAVTRIREEFDRLNPAAEDEGEALGESEASSPPTTE